MLLPFLGLSLVLGALTVRQARDVEKVGFSPVQFLLVAASFTALVVAANAASEGAWTSPKTLGLLALAFALLAGFTWISRRSDAPLLRVRIFADRTYSLSLAYAVLIQAAVLALGYLIPYFAQVAKSTGSFAAGCLLLPGCVIGAILTPFGGRLLDRFGAKRPILAGAAVGVATLACFAAFGAEGSAVRLAVIYAFFPICQGLSLSNSMTHGLRSLPEELQADGNAAFNTVQQLGGAIGTAVATAIVNAAQAADPADPVAATTALSARLWRLRSSTRRRQAALETWWPGRRRVPRRRSAFCSGRASRHSPPPSAFFSARGEGRRRSAREAP